MYQQGQTQSSESVVSGFFHLLNVGHNSRKILRIGPEFEYMLNRFVNRGRFLETDRVPPANESEHVPKRHVREPGSWMSTSVS